MTMPTSKLVLAAVAVVALTACGSDESPAEDASPASAAPTATTATDPSSASAAAPANAFEGTWVSDPISIEDATDALEAAGMPHKVDKFFTFMDGPGDVAFPADNGTGNGVVISLELQAGQWTALYSVDDSPFETLDTGGTYVPNGPETIEYTNLGAQVTTLGWTVEDGTLEFEWVSGNTVEIGGTTEEVIQRALYTSVPFRPQTS